MQKTGRFILFWMFLCIIYIIVQSYMPVSKIAPKEVISDAIRKKQWAFRVQNINAVIFFGRRRQVSILMRYLEKNIKENGGVLDKIILANCANAKRKDDLRYLASLVNQNKSYIKILDCPVGAGFGSLYETFEDDDLIFKIDDDIVFISNGTFESMLNEYMNNNLLFLSANVINHYLLSWVHARMTAIMPFREVRPSTWELDNSTSLHKILTNHTYATFSQWWSDPRAAAIAHESFLYHLNNNNLHLYDFKKWDFNSEGYDRWSINFVLMRGKYVNRISKLVPLLDKQNGTYTITDEIAISQELPRIYDKHSFALGSAIVSHFSYNIQKDYLYSTDILNKYDVVSKLYLNLK